MTRTSEMCMGAPTEKSGQGVSDFELIQRVARSHDRPAFALLLERHRSVLYNLALRMTRNSVEAEDALQQAMMRIWTSAGSFRKDGEVETWMLRVLARECLRIFKRRGNELRRISTYEGQREARQSEPVGAEAEDAEGLQALRRCLAELPEPQRMLVTLYFGAGISQDEISRRLRIPQATISLRIKKSLEGLRSGLARLGITAAPLVHPEVMNRLLLEGPGAPAGWMASLANQVSAAGPGVQPFPASSAALASAAPARIGPLALGALGLLTLAGALTALASLSSQTVSPPVTPAWKDNLGLSAADATSRPVAESLQAGPFIRDWDFKSGIPSEFIRSSRFARDASGPALVLPEGENEAVMINEMLPPAPLYCRAQLQVLRPGKGLRYGVTRISLRNEARQLETKRLGPDPTMRPGDIFTYECYLVDAHFVSLTQGRPHLYSKTLNNHPPYCLALVGQNYSVLQLHLEALELGRIPRQIREIIADEGGAAVPRRASQDQSVVFEILPAQPGNPVRAWRRTEEQVKSDE